MEKKTENGDLEKHAFLHQPFNIQRRRLRLNELANRHVAGISVAAAPHRGNVAALPLPSSW